MGRRGLIKTLQDINLDELRKNYARLYYFGLGFIQLKIDETYRLHFYSPKLPPIVESPHNHRYDFWSTVLQGSLTNTRYAVAYPEDKYCNYLMTNESCNIEKEAPILDKPCNVQLGTVDIFTAGQGYGMFSESFHTVTTKDNCITFLKRGEYKKDYAQVILPKDGEKICPFSKKVSEEDLWKLMKEMLCQT